MHGLAPQQIPPDLGGLDPVPTIPQPSPCEPPLDDEGEVQPPAPLPPPGPAVPAILPAPALAQAVAPGSQRGSLVALLAGAGLQPWVIFLVAMTPMGQRMLGIEHTDPAQERAAIVAQVRQELGADLKAQVDALRQELARDREAHERQHALEERGAERELAALREEVRLLREAVTPKRR